MNRTSFRAALWELVIAGGSWLSFKHPDIDPT
jgi:hypothetical protein